MALVCVKELSTRSTVPFSTPYNKFHLYSIHAVGHDSIGAIGTRGAYRPNDRPRSSQRPLACTWRIFPCAARQVRQDQAAKRPEPLRQRLTIATERHRHHAPRAQAADGHQLRKEPLDRFLSDRAALSRARQRPDEPLPPCHQAGHAAGNHISNCSHQLHHLQPSQALAASTRGEADVSFSRGHQVGFGSKEGRPGKCLEALRARGRVPRSKSSCLPAVGLTER